MKQDAKDAHKPDDRFNELLSKFPADEGTGTPGGEQPTTPTGGQEPPKAEEAIPAAEPPKASAEPNAESASEKDVETMKAELAEANAQIAELTTALETATRALADENSDTWKHKYDVLNGIAQKKTGPRIKELETEVERLTAELKTANAGTQKATGVNLDVKVTESDKKHSDNWGVSPEDVASLRNDIMREILATIKQEHSEKPVDTSRQEPAAADTEAGKKTAQPQTSAKSAFLAVLDATAKGWNAVLDKGAREQAFVKFLREHTADVAGEKRTYYSLLAEASGHVLDAQGNSVANDDGNPVIDESKFNARRVAWFYNEFMKSEHPAQQPKPSRESADTKSNGGDKIPTETDTWSPERVRKFNADVQSGTIERGSEEYKRLMASYDAWRSKV